MNIGERIAARRKQLGLTQEELAHKLGYTSKSTINKIELGINDLRQSKIKEVAEALDVTPGYLMGWEDEEPAPDPLTEKRQKVVDAVMQLSDEQLEGLLAFLKK